MKVLKIEIRFIYGKDFDRVIEIAVNNNESTDPDSLYTDWLNGSGMLAVDEEDCPIGFCIYQLEDTNIFINHLIVDTTFHRSKVGTTLINRMKQKLNDKRTSISLNIDEDNLNGQLFLKSLGFKAKLVRTYNGDFLEFKYIKESK